jgi:polysaccharide deacetylase family protein (PEP-CTERM system associated)
VRSQIPANLLTVDLEEWFHLDEGVVPPGEWEGLPSRIEATARIVLSLLDRCQARATFFALGWVAARHQELIREIHARGHEVATHGYLHRSVGEMSDAEFRADLRRAREAVEGATGAPVLGHRAARWSLGGTPGAGRHGRASGVLTGALDILIEEGFAYDSSLAPIVWVGDPAWRSAPYLIERPGGSIREFPPLVGRFLGVRLLMAGGWALRRVPNRILLKTIARANQSCAPVVVDIHAWELDPDPPRIPLPLRYRLAHYDGLANFPRKLERLLRRLEWSPIRDSLERGVGAAR